MIRVSNVGMNTHRDGISSEHDRTTFTVLTAQTDKPSVFVLRLLKSTHGDQVSGPFEAGVRRIEKANGRVVVGGPIALGH